MSYVTQYGSLGTQLREKMRLLVLQRGEATGAALAFQDAADNFAVGAHGVVAIISARLMGERPNHATCAF